MFEGFGAAFLTIFNLHVIIALACGSALGLTFGAIPGLGGIIAMSVLLPFTYSWDTTTAVYLFCGIMGASAFGGSISAILLNTPGTAVNVATCFDGYPMARRGEAAKALGISATASLCGALFGLVVLAVLIQVMRPLVLAFGHAEIFWLVVFGLVATASISQGSLLDGLIAGGTGILLSLIGLSEPTGLIRYTMGSEYLWDGIPLVPFFVGLFAIGELINYSARGGTIQAENISAEITGTWDGVVEVFRHPVCFLRSSIIGTLIGIIPGVGGETANLIAYTAAVQASSNPSSFGKGNPEGVIASESANDSKDGGALLTTLSFGIPGSLAMALLLSIFIIHGVPAGPRLIAEQPIYIWTLLIGYVVANVFASTFGLLAARYLAIITRVPVYYLSPVIAVISLVGAYVLRENIWDVLLVLILGVFGFAIRQAGLPILPLVIGFVLGNLAEKSFLLTLGIHNGSYLGLFSSVISWALIAVTLAIPLLKILRVRHEVAA
jgi:putative tricarboxylic transport membrane protein